MFGRKIEKSKHKKMQIAGEGDESVRGKGEILTGSKTQHCGQNDQLIWGGK